MRNKFWEEQEAEEKKRKDEEIKKREEELVKLEKLRLEREVRFFSILITLSFCFEILGLLFDLHS